MAPVAATPSSSSAFALAPLSLADASAQLYTRAAEVSSVALGAHILSTSDEWFAPASDLVKVAPAQSRKGEFNPKGATFDGWETRRHNPLPQGYDWVILRLGPSAGAHILGLDVDTAHFNGNEAPEVEVHALSVSPEEEQQAQGPAHIEEDDPRWTVLLPRTPCGPSQQHLYASKTGTPTEQAYTHVKLVMVPDGGIARFRVYGTIPPPPPGLGIGEVVASGSGKGSADAHLNTLDLAHVLNGGRVIFTSDQHFGAGSNIILPGRGRDMGDGWETKRSRSPDHKDWVVIQLAQRGYLTSAEIDTIHFLGNFPDSVELHALDLSSQSQWDVAKLGDRDEGVAGWKPLLARTKVGPGKQHIFDLQQQDGASQAATHVRVTMLPDGGIKRVRIVGRRADLVDAALGGGATTSLPAVPPPTADASSSYARAGRYAVPTSYPVTGKSVFDSELRALLLLPRSGGGEGEDTSSAADRPCSNATLNSAGSRSHLPPTPTTVATATASSGPGAQVARGAGAGDASLEAKAEVEADGLGPISIPIEPLTREAYAPYGSVIAGPSPSSASPSQDVATSKTVNQGTAAKFLSLAPITSLYPEDAQPAPAQFHVFRSSPRFALGGADQPARFAIKVLERHRFTTQAFVPMTHSAEASGRQGRGQQGYLVIVALPDKSKTTTAAEGKQGEEHEHPPDLRTLRAFLATTTQGISYHPGVWHHPLIALGDAPTDFACVVHESARRPELDCDEVFYGDGDGQPFVVVA